MSSQESVAGARGHPSRVQLSAYPRETRWGSALVAWNTSENTATGGVEWYVLDAAAFVATVLPHPPQHGDRTSRQAGDGPQVAQRSRPVPHGVPSADQKGEVDFGSAAFC